MKRYYFNNDSYTETPICSCCDYEELMECYNINHEEHPEIIQNGTSHSIEECYQQTLEWENIPYEITDDMNWEEGELYLQELMERYGLQIVIEEYENDTQG